MSKNNLGLLQLLQIPIKRRFIFAGKFISAFPLNSRMLENFCSSGLLFKMYTSEHIGLSVTATIICVKFALQSFSVELRMGYV